MKISQVSISKTKIQRFNDSLVKSTAKLQLLFGLKKFILLYHGKFVLLQLGIITKN